MSLPGMKRRVIKPSIFITTYEEPYFSPSISSFSARFLPLPSSSHLLYTPPPPSLLSPLSNCLGGRKKTMCTAACLVKRVNCMCASSELRRGCSHHTSRQTINCCLTSGVHLFLTGVMGLSGGGNWARSTEGLEPHIYPHCKRTQYTGRRQVFQNRYSKTNTLKRVLLNKYSKTGTLKQVLWNVYS